MTRIAPPTAIPAAIVASGTARKAATPTSVETIFPPTTGHGCASGLAGTANTSTADAPIGATITTQAQADALRRLETMIVLGTGDLPLHAVREQITSAIDLVVQVARGDGGERRIVAVHEVLDASGGGPTTTSLTDGGVLVAVPGRDPRARDAGGPSTDWIGT